MTVPQIPARPHAAPAPVLAALRDELDGSLMFPGEPGYELATPWNVAVQRAPIAVVRPDHAEDIARTVRAAADAGLRVSVQRTGHGATPYDEADVILVHTAAFDRVVIDPDARTAVVGAGVIWQQVIDAAAPHGLAPLVGSSPNVGVAGFLTGAGLGPLSRTYGLSSDHVRAFQVVTGDGRVIRTTPTEHPDLFWGLRGGKATLGIVSEIEIELVPLERFYGGALYFDGADAPAVLDAWRRWCADLPDHANTSLALLQLPPLPSVPAPLAGRLTVAVRYTSVASPENAEAVFGPIRSAATPILDGIAEMPFAAIAAVHADPVDPMPTAEHSLLLRELAPETVNALLGLAGSGSDSPQTIVELRLLGGAIAGQPAHGSAYSHRAAVFSLLAIGVLAPPVAAAVMGHGEALEEAMVPWGTGGALPNFTASADPARIARCYDDEARTWLAALAEQHDPAGVLNVGQVVRAPRATPH